MQKGILNPHPSFKRYRLSHQSRKRRSGLDGKTGELIWEHWTGPANRQDMRNIPMYDDKIIQSTTDARIVALDARTGQKVGNTDC
ncbi:MAG: hypothetical protein Ct9H90mP25_0720 [Gammaproteobacteria bacterium]|nr:MAG: hypothetical protein Ct9H90mP25_0720 [Gammaproteobacteria bacterium]